MNTHTNFAVVVLAAVALSLLVLLAFQSVNVETTIAEWPTPVPTHTPAPTHTPVPTLTPASETAYRLAQHMDNLATIDDTYQAAASADKFVDSEFLYQAGPLHTGRIVVPTCRQLDGFPLTRYAVAVPDTTGIQEILIAGANEIGDFVLQADTLDIGGGTYSVYVSAQLLDCQEFEGGTWMVR